jgi:hypothetical protein
VIKINEWNAIGITFPDTLNFDQYSGSINLLSGVTFNNISYYLPSGLGRLSSVLTRPWLRVLRSEANPNQTLTWYDWYYLDPIAKTKNTWKQVYIEDESTSYIFSPEDIHKAYVGTNKSIVDDDQTFNISNRDFSVINEVSWSRYSNKPI